MERPPDSAPLLIDAREHTRESLLKLAREMRATGRKMIVDHCYVLEAATMREVSSASDGRISFHFSLRPEPPDQSGS